MKRLSSIPVLILLMLHLSSGAQEINDRILLTVDGKGVPAGEFIRMYNKSGEPGKLADIDTYLQQYIIFRLKVADALNEGFDTTRAFLNELKGYRNQLAQSYLTDTGAKEKLLRETYKRSLTEINAWHILINCPVTAKPEDTLIAWQKASDIRGRILNGESFEQVARGASDDPSVKINGGNLGYFTVFQMIMPFEDAAYNLRAGAVSQPVRTSYGYHIIRVADKRPAKGKVLAAHIMKTSPPGSDEKAEREAEESIKAIYEELKAGASFSELAAKHSDHKESATSGGKLNWFGAGEIIPDFSEAAFSIKDTGDYTPPVRTLYGWHIIKLLDRKPHGSFEETRSYLESRLNQSYLNSLSQKTFVEKLKKEYKFRINQEIFRWFVEHTDTLILRGMAKYTRTGMPSGYVYSFADQHLTARELASHIERIGSATATDNPAYFVNQAINARLSDQIIKYEDSMLETKYPAFRYLMNEFHDGILLFEISGIKVWNRVQEDSAGLQNYYDLHKNEYLTRKGIEGKLYTLEYPGAEKAMMRAYRRSARKPDCDALMSKKFNTDHDTVLVIKKGKWFDGDDKLTDNIKWDTGPQSVKISNRTGLLVVERVMMPEPMAFEDVQAEMMTGYQEYLDNEWIKQLKSGYTVKIDNQVYEEVKKSIKN